MEVVQDYGDMAIDFSKIVYVGKKGGDPAWISYKVHFAGNVKLEIMESRKGCGFQMPRHEFIKIWMKLTDDPITADKIASAIAHRVCCGTEHDPPNGKLHGYCIVCGVEWPCETAKKYL